MLRSRDVRVKGWFNNMDVTFLFPRQNPIHMVYRRPHIAVNRHRKVWLM